MVVILVAYHRCISQGNLLFRGIFVMLSCLLVVPVFGNHQFVKSMILLFFNMKYVLSAAALRFSFNNIL